MRLMALVVCVLFTVPASAQQGEGWQIAPGAGVTKYFPGETLSPSNTYGAAGTQYAGTAVGFTARCFHPDLPNIALTFGGGVTWFTSGMRPITVMPLAVQEGIGQTLAEMHEDFIVFPLSVGVQAVFPYANRDNIMFFAGVEGAVNLISGKVPMNQQAKLGYSFLGGFSVKVFEFGVRYLAFSDMKNLGAYCGLRFHSFSL
jgi:hypothetical protein